MSIQLFLVYGISFSGLQDLQLFLVYGIFSFFWPAGGVFSCF